MHLSPSAQSIREARLQRGLTLGAVASRTGIHKATLSRWESGQSVPTPAAAERVLRDLVPNRRDNEVLPFAPTTALGGLIHGPSGGSYLRGMRLRAGLNQSQLGEKLGVTQARVSRWELGDAWPGEAEIIGLVSILAGSAEERDELLRVRGLYATRNRLAHDQLNELTLEELVDDLHNILAGRGNGFFRECLSMDLIFARVESLFLSHIASRPDLVPLLARVFAREAQVLAEGRRWSEAEVKAQLALRIAPAGTQSAALAKIVMAKSASASGSRSRRLSTSHSVFEDVECAPNGDIRSWMISVVAESAMKRGEKSRAVKLAQRARQVAVEQHPDSVWYRSKELAQVLVAANRGDEALSVLPPPASIQPDGSRGWVTFIEEASIWAAAFWISGESALARQWFQAADTSARSSRLTYLQAEVDALGRRLNLSTPQIMVIPTFN